MPARTCRTDRMSQGSRTYRQNKCGAHAVPAVSFWSPPGQPDIAHGRRSVAHAQRSLQTTRKAVTLRKKEAPSRTPARARARVGGARGMRGIAEVWVEDCGALARREQRRSPSTRATPPLCQGRRRLRASPLPSGTKSGQTTDRHCYLERRLRLARASAAQNRAERIIPEVAGTHRSSRRTIRLRAPLRCGAPRTTSRHQRPRSRAASEGATRRRHQHPPAAAPAPPAPRAGPGRACPRR